VASFDSEDDVEVETGLQQGGGIIVDVVGESTYTLYMDADEAEDLGRRLIAVAKASREVQS
jgi:hypothetical protein